MSKFVKTTEIRAAVKGRETEVLDALGIQWRKGRPHIDCPYPSHGGAADWRWDHNANKARCTCTPGDTIFDIVMRREGCDFEVAKLRVAELLGRDGLIRESSEKRHSKQQAMDPTSLLNPPQDLRDDALVRAYLGHRLGIPAEEVPLPSTPVVGLKALGYYDAPPPGSKAKPKLIGTYPCAVFATVAVDGSMHAHRIYTGPAGARKADLGIGPDGQPRDPKKSAKALDGDNTSGRSVLWGDAERAPHIIITEGIETGAAVALAMSNEIAAGEVAVAAAISANGVEAFQPYPAIALPGGPGESIDWLHVLRRDGADAVRAGILAASPFAPTPAELEPAKAGIAGRPLIRVMGGDLADATAAALKVLASERDPLASVYVRGSLLMRPNRIRERLNAGNIRRPLDALILRPVDVDWLRLRLAQRADFYVVAMKQVKPVDVPLGICRCVLAAAPWDGLPTLTGIIEAPTILPGGSVIQAPGYDSETGLLLDLGDTQFPQVPSAPTRAQAEGALRTLRAPFRDFPFVDEASHSVTLAAVLTVLVRRGLRAAPPIAFDAPKMGSGKTLIATVCSYIATGRGPYLMAQVADPTDERKRLPSALLENPAVIVLDNVEHPLRSDSLCIALTEPSFTLNPAVDR